MNKNWARELAAGKITLKQLHDLGVSRELCETQAEAIQKFLDIRVPNEWVDSLQNSGISKQILPTTSELQFDPAELEDPIGDERFSPVPGLTHRYPDRVLIKPTHLCASYCRFCFRRYKVSKPEFTLNKKNS